MKKTRTWHSWAALCLAALIVQVVLLKEWHVHFADHHEAALHCASTGTERHIHSEEYAHVDCSICLFHFSPAPLDFPFWALKAPLAVKSDGCFSYQNPDSCLRATGLFLRGPPFGV